jgi:lysophospholipase L1-like esterase
MCLAPVIRPDGPAPKGQGSSAQGLSWVSQKKRFALKGLEMPAVRFKNSAPIPAAVGGPFRANSGEGNTQGKPWAKLFWPLWATDRKRPNSFGPYRQSARFFLFVGLVIFLQSWAENAQADRAKSVPILMVGDSLTVGGFGEAVGDYLLHRFGSNNVAIFACCGSSPEHWVRSGPNYITKCGYREQTARSTILYDFERGRRPKRVLTPKLEDLVAKFRPRTVIVQLGTNWMDGMHSNPARDESTYGEILDRFVAAIHSEPNTVRKIIWITPPDSSRYSKVVQRRVTNLIKTASRRHTFEIIDSSRLTHYVRGQSGGDGVHYNKAAAQEWANRVTRELDSLIR